MKRMSALFLFALLIFASSIAIGRESLRLATTTSTENTGLLDYLLPDFEKSHGVRVDVVAVGTGKALRLARDGEADVVMVHAPKMEKTFLDEGYGIGRKEFMYNDFVIVGPKSDPSRIKGKSVVDAFKLIARNRETFVSRGDDSGTDAKEKEIWTLAGLHPVAKKYIEVGQGMEATMYIANEKNAYTMCDRATFSFMQDKLRLEILVEGDSALFNQYSIIIVNPEKVGKVNFKKAKEFERWILSMPTLAKIAAFKKNGKQLFFPNVK